MIKSQLDKRVEAVPCKQVNGQFVLNGSGAAMVANNGRVKTLGRSSSILETVFTNKIALVKIPSSLKHRS